MLDNASEGAYARRRIPPSYLEALRNTFNILAPQWGSC